MSDQREHDLDRIRATYAAYDRDGRTGLWDRRNPGFARVSKDRDDATIRLVLKSLAAAPEGRVLDLGCGEGGLAAVLGEANVRGIDVTGVDLLPSRLAVARTRAPTATFVEASADALPFDDGKFSVVTALTLFSSLPSEDLEHAVAQEIGRVLQPDGWLVWYDLRVGNPRNRAVHGIDRHGLERLFPGWAIDIRSITVAPPLARHLGWMTPILYPTLEALPPLRTHLIGRLRCPT